MKCTKCGTSENVLKVKHLPLPQGIQGHITLKEWTEYCESCIKEQSESFHSMMQKHISNKKETRL